MATKVVNQASQAISDAVNSDGPSFEATLHGSGEQADPKKVLAELVKAIQDRLAKAGVPLQAGANQEIEVRVTGNGFRIDGNHPRAAEIEAQLNGDEQLLRLANQLQESGGPLQFLVSSEEIPRLTSLSEGTTIQRAGGYANWLAD